MKILVFTLLIKDILLGHPKTNLMKRMTRAEIRKAAKSLRDELSAAAPGWAHGVTVSDDHTLVTVHVRKKGVLRLSNSYGGVMLELVECGGRPCMHSVMKHNIDG